MRKSLIYFKIIDGLTASVSQYVPKLELVVHEDFQQKTIRKLTVKDFTRGNQ